MYKSFEEHGYTTVYCAKCGEEHKIVQRCGYRYCPACGHITRWRVRERLHQLFKLYHRRRGYMLKMLTLSKQNCPDLKEGIDDLIASFRRIRQTKFWLRHVDGGLLVIEVKGRPGDWHPHIHAFIYSLRIPWQGILDRWSKASNGGQAVWITNISSDKAIYYVTKYVTKPSFGIADLDALETAMKGRRTFQRFGSFHKVKLPTYYTAKPCPICGNTTWLTEWEIAKWHREFNRRL
jgi:predicted RNA-binding Zn-ribbon protein involved in translation (DUF1610 family)